MGTVTNVVAPAGPVPLARVEVIAGTGRGFRSGTNEDGSHRLYGVAGRREAGYIPAAAFVNAYLGLGDYERALKWLDRAFDERSNIVLNLKVHPFFDPLRNDPRYAALQLRMNFPK